MNMPRVELSMYEAFTQAGVTPDAARKVEREVEAAIQAGRESVRAEVRDQLMTRADGLALKADLKAEIAGLRGEMHKALNEQTWKQVGFVVVANGLMVALMKYLP